MNLSSESYYENVKTLESLSKSSRYRKLNDLLNVNADFEVRIYCPLCIQTFTYKFHLFEHLRTYHNKFLSQASNHSLRFIECSFCNSKFYGKHLMAKHVLHHHSKVVKALFINKYGFKCSFCNEDLNQKYNGRVLEHFEEYHFLNFLEEFSEMFLCDTSQEMSMSELINSTIRDEDSHSGNWEDVCMNMGKQKNDSDIQNFDEASRINCYDFTDLKQQLENIKNEKKRGAQSANKSILKDVKNCNIPRSSARRVLKFDIPSDSGNKENLTNEEQVHAQEKLPLKEELCLPCDFKKPNLFFKSNETFCGEPQHSSTPNYQTHKVCITENQQKIILHCKPNFKSHINEKKVNEFEFQCGKCRLLFKENLELVSHVKNSHKRFSLNALQPCYHCAICNAKFYKNHYLRKHHNLHKPY